MNGRPVRTDSEPWWAEAKSLAGRAIQDDRQATEQLMVLVQPWILRLAGSQFPYRGDAEDVAQNVMITVMRRIEGLREPERLRSWLAAITFNEVRGFYRKQIRERDRLETAAGPRPTVVESPERTSVLGGLRVDLLDGMEQLSAVQAFALGLRQFGLPYAEIATEMSKPDRLRELFGDREDPVPEGSVKRWVSEARTVLRAKLD